MTNFAESYRTLLRRIIERDATPEDGLSEASLAEAEARLGVPLPSALRAYYRLAGNLDEVNREHNRLLRPAELEIEGEHLLFMEENQAVVLWGIRAIDLHKDDPIVWQSVNQTPREWHSEAMSVSQFLREMFVWTFGLEEGM